MNEYYNIVLIQNEGIGISISNEILNEINCQILYTVSVKETLSLPENHLNRICLIICDIDLLTEKAEQQNLQELIDCTKSKIIFITKSDTTEEQFSISQKYLPVAYLDEKASEKIIKANIELNVKTKNCSLEKNESDEIGYLKNQLISLKKSEEQFRQVWDKSIDGMRLVDVNGKTILVNDAFCRLVEKKKNELEGKDFSEIYNYSIKEISDPEIRKSILKKFTDRIMSDEIEPTFEKELFLWNSKKVWFQLSNSILKQDDGSRVVLSIFRDISENKIYEEKLNTIATELKELNDSKDKFISILSHDLRGPFHGFLGITEVLANDISFLSPEEIKESATMLNKALTNQYLLLEDLLTWSRIQTKRIEINFENIKAAEEVLSVIVLLRPNAENKQITIVCNVEEDIELNCDRAMFKLLFRNLIANAVKFSFNGGIVNVDSKIREKGIIFAVADNGIGISETDKKKLFRTDIHFTTKGTADEAGTGLGLILCKEIVDLHKGKIWVDSTPGGGSTFNVFIPYPEEMNSN